MVSYLCNVQCRCAANESEARAPESHANGSVLHDIPVATEIGLAALTSRMRPMRSERFTFRVALAGTECQYCGEVVGTPR